uniref:Putative serpentine type 7tm gpcr chemoreceptor srz n=1 Tax=Ixodes scapularis TaxID=6945 RepID=A0A4D5RFJ3_IXOSC
MFVMDFVQILVFGFLSSRVCVYVRATLETREKKKAHGMRLSAGVRTCERYKMGVVVRSGLLLFFVVQIVSFLQCSIFLKIKNPRPDLPLPKSCLRDSFSCTHALSFPFQRRTSFQADGPK